MLLATDSAPGGYLKAGCALLVLQMAVFICGLPPFQFGIWWHVEPVVLALLILSAFTAGWLFIGLQARWLEARYYAHPLWWIFMGWVVWQLLTLRFANSLWISWFGQAVHGIGAAWYISVWLYTLLAFVLWQDKKLRIACLGAASLLLLVQITIYAFISEDSAYSEWRPIAFGTYLTFVGGWLWICWMQHLENQRIRWFFLLALCMLATLYVSMGKTAILLMIPALFLTYAGLEYGFARFEKHLRVLAIALIVLSAAGWMIVSQHSEFFPDKRGSLAIRAAMNEIGFGAIAEHPPRLMAGKGWGNFTEDNFQNPFTEGTYLVKDGHYESYAPLYETMAFHSHNQYLEALLALGMVGLLLWFAFPLATIYCVPSASFWAITPMLGALTLMSYLWFFVPHHLGYLAFATAAILSACLPAGSYHAGLNKLFRVVMIAAAFVMCVSAGAEYKAIRYGETMVHDIFNTPADRYAQSFIESDIARGGERLRHVSLEAVNGYAMSYKNAGENEAKWMQHLLQAARNLAMAPSATNFAASTELQLYSQLYLILGGEDAYSLSYTIKNFWPNAVFAMAARAPHRDDMATEYLDYLRDTSDYDRNDKIDTLKQLLAVNPNHRIAMYVLGTIYMESADTQEAGNNLIATAKMNGLNRFYLEQ